MLRCGDMEYRYHITLSPSQRHTACSCVTLNLRAGFALNVVANGDQVVTPAAAFCWGCWRQLCLCNWQRLSRPDQREAVCHVGVDRTRFIV